MKRITAWIFTLVACLTATAQTMNVTIGDVTYLIPASQAGEMIYNGTTVTIMGKEFYTSDITQITVDDTEVTDNAVNITYSGTSAKVTIAGNVAKYVDATVTGAHVSIAQSNTELVDSAEITYILSGETCDGEFALSGSFKCTVSLAGVDITNPSGAAINITNSKRIQFSAKKNTTNTLTDCSNGSQKACVYSKGQLQLQGNGVLNVVGNTKHAIKSGDYVSVKNLTLNITGAVSDGISCEEYFQMKSGTVTISGVGDDGIQCDLGGTASTGVTTDHEGEDTGNMYFEGGTLNVNVPSTATAGKCVKSAGDIIVSAGTFTLSANGDIDLTDTTNPSYTAGFKADGNFTQSGGDITIDVTGAAGRGIGVTNTFTTTAESTGTLTITNSGATKSSNTTNAKYFCTAKGVKAGVVAINGGTINVTMSGAAAKGIKSDKDDGFSGDMSITGGNITVTTSGNGAYDATDSDAKGSGGLKSDANMSISGGTITLESTGTGGKCIKSDGTLNISGGTVSRPWRETDKTLSMRQSPQTTVNATSKGSKYSYSSYITASPKGIKSAGAMTISDGTVTAESYYHEGIESKTTLTISGGTVTGISGADDAINCSSDMTISGGTILAYSSGANASSGSGGGWGGMGGGNKGGDGLDANGNIKLSGGTVVAYGTKSPECGIDANEEGGKTVFFTGGCLFGIGGNNSHPTTSASTQCYGTSSGTVTANTTATLKSGSTTLATFTLPYSYSSSGSIIVTAPGMTKGSSYTLSLGSSSKSVTATQYSSGGGWGHPSVAGVP